MNASDKKMNPDESGQLLIVWTSGDPEVALKMVFMYAYNAQKNGWWDHVTLLIWGPSEKLSSENAEIQEYLAKMQEVGIELIACRACADMYGVCPSLEDMNIDVKYTGTYLTDYIKSGKKLISF
jgi:hypothetical protein